MKEIVWSDYGFPSQEDNQWPMLFDEVKQNYVSPSVT